MSIDYGKRRTGVAVSDPLQIIAGGLETVDTPKLLDYIKAYTAKETVERIIIGMPTQPNGVPSENAGRVNLQPTLKRPSTYLLNSTTSVSHPYWRTVPCSTADCVKKKDRTRLL